MPSVAFAFFFLRSHRLLDQAQVTYSGPLSRGFTTDSIVQPELSIDQLLGRGSVWLFSAKGLPEAFLGSENVEGIIRRHAERSTRDFWRRLLGFCVSGDTDRSQSHQSHQLESWLDSLSARYDEPLAVLEAAEQFFTAVVADRRDLWRESGTIVFPEVGSPPRYVPDDEPLRSGRQTVLSAQVLKRDPRGGEFIDSMSLTLPDGSPLLADANIIHLCGRRRVLVLLGDSGAGKSTFAVRVEKGAHRLMAVAREGFPFCLRGYLPEIHGATLDPGASTREAILRGYGHDRRATRAAKREWTEHLAMETMARYSLLLAEQAPGLWICDGPGLITPETEIMISAAHGAVIMSRGSNWEERETAWVRFCRTLGLPALILARQRLPTELSGDYIVKYDPDRVQLKIRLDTQQDRTLRLDDAEALRVAPFLMFGLLPEQVRARTRVLERRDRHRARRSETVSH